MRSTSDMVPDYDRYWPQYCPFIVAIIASEDISQDALSRYATIHMMHNMRRGSLASATKLDSVSEKMTLQPKAG